MNQKVEDFSLKKILVVWIGLTVLLVLTGLFVFVLDAAFRAFVVLLNTINLGLFACFILFRNNIQGSIANCIDESGNSSISIKFNYKKGLGFTLVSPFIFFCSYIIFLALFDIESYSRLIAEDGIVEYGSAIFWFLSTIIVCFHTIKLLKEKVNKRQIVVNMTLMAFFIVCSGEEISWGQRLFDIDTPDAIKSINVQDEITLHNIGSISVFSNAFFLLTVVFFLVVPFLIQKYTRIKQVLYFCHFPIPNRLAIYVYVVTLFVWILVGLRFGTLGFHPFSFFPEQYYNQMDDEIFELFAAYSFFCFSILNNAKEITIIKHQSAG